VVLTNLTRVQKSTNQSIIGCFQIYMKSLAATSEPILDCTLQIGVQTDIIYYDTFANINKRLRSAFHIISYSTKKEHDTSIHQIHHRLADINPKKLLLSLRHEQHTTDSIHSPCLVTQSDIAHAICYSPYHTSWVTPFVLVCLRYAIIHW
jgi:hypothetical protein